MKEWTKELIGEIAVIVAVLAMIISVGIFLHKVYEGDAERYE